MDSRSHLRFLKSFFFPSYVLRQWDSFGRRLRPNPMVAEWFARVNSDPSEFLVHMVDALPLWRALPTPSQPDGIGLNDRDEVVTFQYQFDRFLWAFHCDRIQRFLSYVGKRLEDR
eukprot:scaffold4991_cov82-Cylindrotheca_fusiformis.AAC.1